MRVCPKCGFIENPIIRVSFENNRATCEPPWRSTFDRMVQYCRPADLAMKKPKLFKLIELYDEAFDDLWWYFYNLKHTYIKRVPIWMNQKRMPAERHKDSKIRVHGPLTKNQTKLLEVEKKC